ncbi:MAG: hypothetical protein ACI9XZ_002051 [Alphaproteobacteria bacterium]|jgi:hypothetical protein
MALLCRNVIWARRPLLHLGRSRSKVNPGNRRAKRFCPFSTNQTFSWRTIGRTCHAAQSLFGDQSQVPHNGQLLRRIQRLAPGRLTVLPDC